MGESFALAPKVGSIERRAFSAEQSRSLRAFLHPPGEVVVDCVDDSRLQPRWGVRSKSDVGGVLGVAGGKGQVLGDGSGAADDNVQRVPFVGVFFL